MSESLPGVLLRRQANGGLGARSTLVLLVQSLIFVLINVISRVQVVIFVCENFIKTAS